MVISNSSNVSVAALSFDKRNSLDAVNAQRKESVSFTASEGPKSRSNTGPSGVNAEVPAIVLVSVGTVRATGDIEGAVDVGVMNENAAQDIIALDTATAADGQPGKMKKANGHARKQSFFSRLPFLRSNSQVDGKAPAPKKEEAADAAKPDAVKLTAIAEELTAQEEARGAMTKLPGVDQGSDGATEDTTLLTPDDMPILAKAEEIEETPLDTENQPPLVAEKDQKKGKSGGFFGCIKPRTAD
ncbi:hypothetical protein [Bordetella sp. LUAb4]|uniref:hypothetical protein n=1 Tax=Bordetella sp. LUAb4 TaxID=2843195 RepID=UPI001E3AB407|nr:hypothetical protein [Bordetella sp. LUAb4]